MSELERDVEARLRAMVIRHGGRCLKFVSPGVSGVPDRLLLLPGGRSLFVETKRPKGGKPSALQKEWQRRLLRLGFIDVFIFSTTQVSTLERVLLERGWIR